MRHSFVFIACIWSAVVATGFAAEACQTVSTLNRDRSQLEGKHLRVRAVWAFDEGSVLVDASGAPDIVFVSFDEDAVEKRSKSAYEALRNSARVVIQSSVAGLLRSPIRRQIEVEFEGRLVLAEHTARHKRAVEKFGQEQAKRTPNERNEDPSYFGMMADFDEFIVEQVNWFRVAIEIAPNQSPEPTAMSVTPPAAQESRQP